MCSTDSHSWHCKPTDSNIILPMPTWFHIHELMRWSLVAQQIIQSSHKSWIRSQWGIPGLCVCVCVRLMTSVNGMHNIGVFSVSSSQCKSYSECCEAWSMVHTIGECWGMSGIVIRAYVAAYLDAEQRSFPANEADSRGARDQFSSWSWRGSQCSLPPPPFIQKEWPHRHTFAWQAHIPYCHSIAHCA